MGLFADKDLIFEGAEFSVGVVVNHSGGGLADLAVRKNDGGRDDALVLVMFDDHAGAALGIGRFFKALVQLGVDIAGGVAHEAAGLEPLE